MMVFNKAISFDKQRNYFTMVVVIQDEQQFGGLTAAISKANDNFYT